jgi:solute carrier family 35 protein E3
MKESFTREKIVEYVNVLLSLSLNVCASCGTIFLNKLLFKQYGFKFGTVLTVCHFVVTFLLVLLCAMCNLFSVKKLELKRVLPISLAFCGYVVFNNISLMYNSVSFYQVMKILCTPAIIAIETLVYNKPTSFQIKLTLIPVCFGIFVTVCTDVEINLIGSIFALVAVGSNAMYTIYGKRKQNELNVNAMQLLLYQSIMSAIILAFCVPVFDNIKELAEYEFTLPNVLLILGTCITAFLVNLSFFLIVGKTSPLSVNVLGYFKTCLVFVGGVLFFDTNADFKNIFGITLTMIGVLLYTYVQLKGEEAKKPKSKQQLDLQLKVQDKV